MEEKVAVVGLGYVGLPVALAFARHFPDTVGFDINERKVAELRGGHDRTGEVDGSILHETTLRMTSDPEQLRDRTFFVVAVPTPVDADNRPDLSPVVRASETVGRALSRGAVVVYESTVYPGVTEEICAPVLERVSGLRARTDFTLGYSPERINPGDTEHTLERITKVVSGQDAETLERVAGAYGRIIAAGVHRAPSIKVAEAAKVIENTQRDLNIALMNEIALICDRLGIRTADVLAAARTKWNFLPFSPGLVGGHCIGVDPYYLTTKAEQTGLPARGHPCRPAHQQPHGRVHRRQARQAAHQRRSAGEGCAGRHSGLDVQGERLRPPQQPGAGHRARACPVRDRGAGA